MNNNKPATFTDIADELEQLQRHLLLLKAAVVAYNGGFDETADIHDARSKYNVDGAAEYFLFEFLERKPDKIIEEAISAIWELKREVDLNCKGRSKALDFKSLI